MTQDKLSEDALGKLVARCETMVHGVTMNDAEALRLCAVTIASVLPDAKAELLALRSATPMPEPVAWRVKDYADGWMLAHTLAQAKGQAGNGNLIQPLYTTPPAREISEAELERVKGERDAFERAWMEASNSMDQWRARALNAEASLGVAKTALKNLLALNDTHSPFGGEIYRDRVDRAWDAARSALASIQAKGE